MTDNDLRTAFSPFRADERERDDGARARARLLLENRIAGRRAARRRVPRRRALVVAVAVATVASGVALASGFWRTEHTGHLPVFTADGAVSPELSVDHRGTGSCWASSLAIPSADTWRCQEDNEIHDPCFSAAPDARLVVCFSDPWRPVTVLALTRPLPASEQAGGPTQPWAIETTDGRRCTLYTGATGSIGGERVSYGCADGSVLLGEPDRGEPLWTIRSATTDAPNVPITSYPLAKIARTIP